jgi:hypothetical protein
MKKILIAALPSSCYSYAVIKTFNRTFTNRFTHSQPDVKMKDITGTEVSFKDAQKKNGLLVIFSCNTCPVVKKYQSRNNEVCKYAMSKEIGVILLNSNEAYRNDGDSIHDMKGLWKKE